MIKLVTIKEKNGRDISLNTAPKLVEELNDDVCLLATQNDKLVYIPVSMIKTLIPAPVQTKDTSMSDEDVKKLKTELNSLKLKVNDLTNKVTALNKPSAVETVKAEK